MAYTAEQYSTSCCTASTVQIQAGQYANSCDSGFMQCTSNHPST